MCADYLLLDVCHSATPALSANATFEGLMAQSVMPDTVPLDTSVPFQQQSNAAENPTRAICVLVSRFPVIPRLHVRGVQFVEYVALISDCAQILHTSPIRH
jgi:hypothetical protein